MAKILIDFQSKLIDLYLLKTVEKGQEWDDKEQEMCWTILINNSVPESMVSTKFKFKFNTEDHRDKEWEILRMKLEDVEFLEIL